MHTKVTLYFWSLRRQFIKYFIVGISGVFIDIGTLIFFREWLGLLPVAAVMINQFVVMGWNFGLNKVWSFQNKEIPHTQLMRYLVVAAGNYVIAAGAMYVFSQQLGFDYRIVRICTIAVAVSWTFFLYKYWVYRSQSVMQISDCT